jgi:hypothetical protein
MKKKSKQLLSYFLQYEKNDFNVSKGESYLLFIFSFLEWFKDRERKEIVMIDNNWKMFNEGTLQRYLKQASKLVFINLLNKMGLNIKVDVNEFGYPVYKLHFLHRFIQMNILTQLFNNKMIDEATKRQIESIIFDTNTRSQLEKEIKKYQSDVTKTGDISEVPANADETSDVEPASFTPPDKEDRLETIKRLMK